MFGDWDRPGWGRRQWKDGGWGMGMGGGGGGRGSARRGARMFEQGDLKYVILKLLAEKPRHGYEIIRTLEEKMGGAYAPSPGAVYPTLTMLEEMGYARSTPEEGGRKIYDITPEGRVYLEQNRSQVEEIFTRIADFASNFFGPPMVDVHRAFKDVARATYVTAMHVKDPDAIRRIHDILARAATEIDALNKAVTPVQTTSTT